MNGEQGSDGEAESGEIVPSGADEAVVGEDGEVHDGPLGLVVARSHSGPLPPAEWFRDIEPIHPGATQMILRDYTQQREHERAMERRSLEFDRESFNAFARYQTLTLIVAGSLAILLTTAGIVLIATGYSIFGLVLLVGEIGTLVLALLGRSSLRSHKPASPDESPTETS